MGVDVSEFTEVTATEPVANPNEKDSDRETIALTVPDELKTLVEGRAKEQNLSTAAYVRELLAREFTYTIPEDFGTKRKYANDEERKAAQKANAQKRNKMVKQLMAAVKAGKIDLAAIMAMAEDDDEDTGDNDDNQ